MKIYQIGMFKSCKFFNQDISDWKINLNTCQTYDMFSYCNIKNEYKPKLPN